MSFRDPISYDPATFRKHFKYIGRAYQEQATTLIAFCRLHYNVFPQTYTESDAFQTLDLSVELLRVFTILNAN